GLLRGVPRLLDARRGRRRVAEQFARSLRRPKRWQHSGRSPSCRARGQVKRRELIRQLEEVGWEMNRHGGNHDWYRNPRTKVSQPVPRHREIREQLAKHILKMLSDGI